MTRDLYLALGDSVTVGYAATHPSLGFAHHVAAFTKAKGSTEYSLIIAKNGWTTKDMLAAAQMLGPAMWHRTNVLTLMTGGNDLRRLLRRQYLSFFTEPISPQLVDRQIQEYGFYMKRLCSFISEQKIPHVVVATVYNPAPRSPLAVESLTALNDVTKEIAAHYKFDVVDIYERFHNRESYFIEGYRSGRFEDLASPIRRPIHPNNMGHREIAETVIAHLNKRFDGHPNASNAQRPRVRNRGRSRKS